MISRRSVLAGTLASVPIAAMFGISESGISNAAGAPRNNPIIPGYFADPWISRFGDRFYLYPTTDGIANWGATSFRAFSSGDLVHWTDHGVILDLADVSWAHTNAWAPSAIFRDGLYYFYFVAAGQIGVATARSPLGPFTDALGKPLVAAKQFDTYPIDPSVFLDDDGQAYLYFGNGTNYVIKLNRDMISFDGDPVNITQPGFREASNVIKRDGVYYLMWSENDTRDVTYHVSNATSSSPLGPFTKAAINPILQENPALGILGTGSSTAFRVGHDHYIAYHRFAIPGGDGMHREVCLDRLYFNPDGTIKPVVPTLTGVSPIRSCS